MTTLNAGDATTVIVSAIDAIKFTATNGSGMLIPINQDGSPGTPVALDGSPKQIDATGAITRYRVNCTGGTLSYDIGRDRNTGSPYYLGHVGTRTHICDAQNAGLATGMHRRAEIAREDLTVFQLVYGNFWCPTTGEAAPGSTRTITVGVEYPLGVFTQVKFSGVASATMADGLARLVSDYITLSIPKGATYWINTRQSAASGVIYCLGATAFGAIGDQSTVGSNVADTTMSTWSGTAGGNPYGPYAIIAWTRNVAVAAVGDSREYGVGYTSNTVPYCGEFAPSLAPFMAYMSLSRGSHTAFMFTDGNFAKRATYLQYASHGIMQPGINDLVAGKTAAQLQSYRQTGRLLAPTLKWFETTLGPETTSTDSWATLTNQTTVASNAVRVAFNDLVRFGNVGFSGYFEMADGMESSRNSGIIAAPPMVHTAITADGVHLNNAGQALNTVYVRPSLFTR